MECSNSQLSFELLLLLRLHLRHLARCAAAICARAAALILIFLLRLSEGRFLFRTTLAKASLSQTASSRLSRKQFRSERHRSWEAPPCRADRSDRSNRGHSRYEEKCALSYRSAKCSRKSVR